LSLLDAWLTTNHIPGVGPLTGRAASLVPLAFVLLGDLRYFVLIESARSDGTLSIDPRRFARACAWTLIVPLTAQLAVTALGSANPRVLFLIYETLFAFVALGISAFYLPRHGNALRWRRGVRRFVIAYYGLWALADAIILTTGADIGFLLRVVPNALYYGGLIAVVAWTAGASADTPPSPLRSLGSTSCTGARQGKAVRNEVLAGSGRDPRRVVLDRSRGDAGAVSVSNPNFSSRESLPHVAHEHLSW
jgi:hypothetical protein